MRGTKGKEKGEEVVAIVREEEALILKKGLV